MFAFFRRRTRPRFRFSGRLPTEGRVGVLLPRHPLLAAFSLDVVASLTRHFGHPPQVVAPSPLPEWRPYLQPRFNLPEEDTPIDLLVDLDPEGRTPLPAGWRSVPMHLSLNARGNFVLEIRGRSWLERWKQGLHLLGVDWVLMHLELPERVRRTAITRLEREWNWRQQRLIFWEAASRSVPLEAGWLFLHGEPLQQQPPDIQLALAMLSQGYVGINAYAWVVHRAGHPAVLVRPPSPEWTDWLQLPVWDREPWETVRAWLNPR